MKSFELLKYDTPDDTDSLGHLGGMTLDLSNDKTLKRQVLKGLKEHGVKVKKIDLSLDLEIGIIEVLNQKGQCIFQLRD